jgi:hypothetical protein
MNTESSAPRFTGFTGRQQNFSLLFAAPEEECPPHPPDQLRNAEIKAL